MSIPLYRLIEILEAKEIRGRADVLVSGISYDSRRVKPGDVFVAVGGFVTDGHEFVGDAVSNGAAAVVLEKEVPVPEGVTAVVVPDTRGALGLLAASFYGHPSKRLRMIGVTGTNGKTTTTYMVRQILNEAGYRVGLIGTVQNFIDDVAYPVTRTTPESLDLQELLSRMEKAGVTHVVMEVSSHGLELKRTNGCEFDVGAFTNLSRDHLDFHDDVESYLEAKCKLFTGLSSTYYMRPKEGPKGAVVNVDDPSSERVRSCSGVPILGYGTGEGADLRATDIRVLASGTTYTAALPSGKRIQISMPLAGRFNVYNSLAALGVALIEGIPEEAIVRAFHRLDRIPGRFERVEAGQSFSVVVDYAHTPDGLEKVLLTAREVAGDRVIVVFGCGGDRDKGKRPVMGRIAGELADFVVLTSDNPRGEEPESIISEIERGLRQAKAGTAPYHVEPDRRAAIEYAVGMARDGDLVLIAGKGHESYQVFRDEKVPFDDREVATEAIRRRLGRK